MLCGVTPERRAPVRRPPRRDRAPVLRRPRGRHRRAARLGPAQPHPAAARAGGRGLRRRSVSTPQLFIEGNRRTALLLASYLLARGGLPPLVVTAADYPRFDAISERALAIDRRGFASGIALTLAASRVADFLQAHRRSALPARDGGSGQRRRPAGVAGVAGRPPTTTLFASGADLPQSGVAMPLTPAFRLLLAAALVAVAVQPPASAQPSAAPPASAPVAAADPAPAAERPEPGEARLPAAVDHPAPDRRRRPDPRLPGNRRRDHADLERQRAGGRHRLRRLCPRRRRSGARPVTFAVNGGPGAASAYLDIGVIGPWRLPMDDEAHRAVAAAALIDNPETWLDFTDLVFIDPVGTGFSRLVEPDDARRDRYLSIDGDVDVALRLHPALAGRQRPHRLAEVFRRRELRRLPRPADRRGRCRPRTASR